MSFSTVIFDLDGTLLDTVDDIRDSLNHALRQYGRPERTRAQVMADVGNGSGRLVRLSLPLGEEDPLFDDILRDYNAWYTSHCRILTRPYPGAVALLRRLGDEGRRLAVVSNKPDSAVKPLCAEFFPGLVSAAVGEREGIRRKPAPDTLLSAMAELGSDAGETVYVGDSEVDIATAKNAGVPCISVLWGFRSRESLTEAGASSLAAGMDELYELLK